MSDGSRSWAYEDSELGAHARVPQNDGRVLDALHQHPAQESPTAVGAPPEDELS